MATHNEAALAMPGGSVDTGMGILPAAKMFGLYFGHRAKKRFVLLIPKQSISAGPIDALLQVVRSEVFKIQVDTTGGYDSSASGHFLAAINTASFLYQTNSAAAEIHCIISFCANHHAGAPVSASLRLGCKTF